MISIFNSVIKVQYFPRAWKQADILTFPKTNKNPIFPQNRRPINLLSGLGKLFERLILKRLEKIVTAKGLTPE